MNEDNDRTSGLTDEKAQFMVDELNALPQRRLDMEDKDFGWYEQGEEAAKEITELSREADPNWYKIAELVAGYCIDNQFYLVDSCWEDWSDYNGLPTETIAKHLEIYHQMTELREIPIEMYERLTPARVDALLEPLLPDEPKVPAISVEIECSSIMALNWWEWEKKLLSALEAG